MRNFLLHILKSRALLLSYIQNWSSSKFWNVCTTHDRKCRRECPSSRNSRKSARYSFYSSISLYSWLLRNSTNRDWDRRRQYPIPFLQFFQGILESQLVIQFTVSNHNTADFWEIVPIRIGIAVGSAQFQRIHEPSPVQNFSKVSSGPIWLVHLATSNFWEYLRQRPNSWALACTNVLKSQLWSYVIYSVYFILYIFRHLSTGWRSPIGCLISCITFRKLATNYRALLWKMTYKDKASYDFTPPSKKYLMIHKGILYD